jgi:creatinine amidohydrolase
MRQSIVQCALACVVTLAAAPAQQPPARPPAPPSGTRLETLPWTAAEGRLRADTVVLLPIGPAALEHGPHLRLGSDAVLLDHIARRVVDGSDVVVAPTLTYHYFPAFAEYPGSTSLALATARDMTADIARSLSRYGPRRFLALTAGPSPIAALVDSARALAADGILLRYMDARARVDSAARRVTMQAIGSHADEIETSMMLHLDPTTVDMTRAVRDYGGPSSPFRLVRRPGVPGTYSATGVWGDATLATADKGRVLVDALVAGVRVEIDATRQAPLPVAAIGQNTTARGDRAGGPGTLVDRRSGECEAGDDRAIRAIGPAFYAAWTNLDAAALAGLWTGSGDIVHPDGFVERTNAVIRQNRAALFGRQEYRSSRHFLTLGQVRCLTSEIAVADAKWELRGVTDGKGQNLPPIAGLSTLVVRKGGEGFWLIEAYRYTTNTQQSSRPTVLQRPGAPEPYR